jgi:hypothetical protein
LAARAIGAAIAMLAIVAPASRVGATPTSAASACTANSGVTVIVDFTHFHLAIERGCAPGRPATALAALQSAGFSTAGTAQYGDAFLCRINNLPSSANEACSQTPPASSSWSFYWAHPTDTDWTYSDSGVTGYQPAAGSLLAFAFGDYAKPGVSPSSAIGSSAPTTTRTTAAPPPTVAPAATRVSTPTATISTTSTTIRAAASSGTATTSPGTAAAATSTTTRGAAVTRAAPSTDTEPRVIERTAAAAGVTHRDSGSPLPALLAVVLVAAVAIGGLFTIRLRKRRTA